jgi:hypothetical protein
MKCEGRFAPHDFQQERSLLNHASKKLPNVPERHTENSTKPSNPSMCYYCFDILIGFPPKSGNPGSKRSIPLPAHQLADASAECPFCYLGNEMARHFTCALHWNPQSQTHIGRRIPLTVLERSTIQSNCPCGTACLVVSRLVKYEVCWRL